MRNDHHHWMTQAQAIAMRSLPQDVPVGALIVDAQGRLIAEGWNLREADFDPSAHAEIVALKRAGALLKNWRLNGCTLYVTLEPCPMCASALIQARISTVVFGALDPVQGAMGSLFNMGSFYSNSVEVIGGIQEDACREQLHQFFRQTRG